MKTVLFFLPLIALTGCYQTYSDDQELRTVPVTNNPNLIPGYGSQGSGSGPFPL